jgi:ribosomal protein RSM22 (predicted rRNA methylase)
MPDMELPADLRDALEAALAGTPARELTGAVDRLIERYRTPGAAAEPILARPVDVLAYTAYRMPATFAAVAAALTQVAQAVPWLAPKSQVDVGGGAGAAAWAAAHVFPQLAGLEVIDRVPAALDLGRRLGLATSRPSVRSATWRLGTWPTELPAADLLTVSYLLGELTEADQADLIAKAAESALAVVVVEPGTPAGYGRVLAARDRLLASCLRVVAPCPHQLPCPLRRDWCHFSARINRSALHRRVKGAELGYEDEKFSYVAAVRDPAPPIGVMPGRILRHPLHRKGMEILRVCTADGTAVVETVSKRQGDRYRAARDLTWGDPWPAAP